MAWADNRSNGMEQACHQDERTWEGYLIVGSGRNIVEMGKKERESPVFPFRVTAGNKEQKWVPFAS